VPDQPRSHKADDFLTVHSQGGLGNQIFILAAGLAHSDWLNTRLRLDLSAHESKDKPPFRLSSVVAKLNETSEFPITAFSYRRGVSRVRRRLEIPRHCSFVEKSPGYSPSSLNVRAGECMTGYFQSWKYLRMLSPERLRDFRSAICSLVADDQYEMSTSDIVVHIRRGDYLKPKNQSFHGVLGLQFYADGIERLRRKGQTGRVWLVSEGGLDDIREWRSTLGDVAQLSSADPWTDLGILKNAPSLVVANSSFSWMGAWLGPEERFVVAPDPWFSKINLIPNELIPPNWIRVQHEFTRFLGSQNQELQPLPHEDEGQTN
jgi:hypothetical protein